MLNEAIAHYERQQRITAAAVIAARQARRSGVVQIARTVIAFQVLAARDASAAVPLMLDEQDLDVEPVARVIPERFAGTASDGRALPGLFEQAATGLTLDLMVATQIQDAARGAAGAEIAVRPRIGYTRMLNPPSCSRCSILAGRFYRWNTGFERHPRCDCRHVPTVEDVAGDLTTNPYEYFDSLPTRAELEAAHPDLTREMRRQAGLYSQEDIFTDAGAKAIRDGADINQVVNARRGMSTAQIAGRDVLVTSEGTTSRGFAGAVLGDLEKRGGRYRSSGRPRIMPDSIYAAADGDRDAAIRGLKANGFIL